MGFIDDGLGRLVAGAASALVLVGVGDEPHMDDRPAVEGAADGRRTLTSRGRPAVRGVRVRRWHHYGVGP
ncbi:MAG: hypothetical protein OEY41_05525 [Acidimicrobiia bacterium]|nr:hypothetical protein [Acidimicrobiia bacterium]MDH5289439.1 hypothetical protein [Acidimicrobiia bacterium]